MFLRKTFLSVAIASTLMLGAAVAATPAVAGYSALAMSDYGTWGFARSYPSPERARINAISACERNAGQGECREIGTWESDSWYFVGISCSYSSYTAASPQGYARARSLAYNKADIADDYDCDVVVQKH